MIPETALVIILAVHAAGRAEVLVPRLGSPAFATREAAARDLIGLGRAAVPALRRGLSHRDAEVADRCGRLIPQAEAEAGRQRTARLRVVTGADPGTAIPTTEILLGRFLAVTGDTRAARQLYFDIHQAHGPALNAIEQADGRAGGEVFWKYVDRVLMYPDGRTRTDLRKLTFNRVDLALFWFLSANPALWPAPCPGLGRKDCPYYFPRHAEGHLAGPGAIPEVRRLFLAWLAGPRNVPDGAADGRMAAAGVRIAVASGLVKEARAAALQLALDPRRPAGPRAVAVRAVVQAGERADADRLAALIPSALEVGEDGPRGWPGTKVYLGDVALAACLQLSGHDPTRFGFVTAGDPETLKPSWYVFQNNDFRAEAHRKWYRGEGAPRSRPEAKR